MPARKSSHGVLSPRLVRNSKSRQRLREPLLAGFELLRSHESRSSACRDCWEPLFVIANPLTRAVRLVFALERLPWPALNYHHRCPWFCDASTGDCRRRLRLGVPFHIPERNYFCQKPWSMPPWIQMAKVPCPGIFIGGWAITPPAFTAAATAASMSSTSQ